MRVDLRQGPVQPPGACGRCDLAAAIILAAACPGKGHRVGHAERKRPRYSSSENMIAIPFLATLVRVHGGHECDEDAEDVLAELVFPALVWTSARATGDVIRRISWVIISRSSPVGFGGRM